MNDRIFMSRPDVGQAERDAVARAFNSGYIAPLGPEVDAFEHELAAYCGRSHCVALSSGTAALHLALLNLGLGPGDVVVTASMTFAATANAIRYTGATPVFVDANELGSIDVALLRQAVADQFDQGARVKAIMPVDLLGKVVDHEAIAEIADAYGLPVISDAAESLGAKRSGRPAAAFGVMAGVSFNGNKIMTTSGGGALLTDDEDLAAHTKYLATQARQPVVWYEHTDIGFNYRLSNLLAAMGRAQLSRLDDMLARRRWVRVQYKDLFADVAGVEVFSQPDGAEDEYADTHDNFWLTSIVIDPDQAGFTRDDLMAALNDANIESRPLWKPMHLQPVYRDCTSYVDGTSERLFNRGLSLPSGSEISDASYDKIFTTIRDFCSAKQS